jgi:hypothetical protein
MTPVTALAGFARAAGRTNFGCTSRPVGRSGVTKGEGGLRTGERLQVVLRPWLRERCMGAVLAGSLGDCRGSTVESPPRVPH